MRKFLTKASLIVVAIGLFFTTPIFAGGKGHQKKDGFFKKVGHAIRHTGDHIVNGVMDGYVKAKQKITGQKTRVWVCGHYDKNGHHVKGHWRIVKHGNPNTPGQSGNPGQGSGQGNPGQGSGGGQPPAPPSQPPTPPAPPSEPPTPPAPPSEPPAPPAPPSEPPAPPTPLPQPGNPGQGGQSGQSSQSNQWQSGEKRTLGGLMKDLIDLSDDMDQIKLQAVDAKNDRSRKNEAAEIEACYQALTEDRDEDAQLLFKVVTSDLQKNHGEAGVYYSAYLRNMNQLSKADRESISDVTCKIKDFIKHRIAHSKQEKAFEARLDEMKKF